MSKVLEMLCFESRYEIRLMSANVISHFLLSQKSEHLMFFVSRGIFDKV